MESKSNSKKNIAETELSITKLPKSLTGIQGLDDITYGGIPQNRPTLLVGSIGTGKTIFAMEYIINGITMFNEPGVFMTFEEQTDELQINVTSMGYNLSKLIADNKIYLEHLHIDHREIQATGKYDIEGLFIRIEMAIEKVKAKRIVLDALDTLFIGLDSQILRSEIKRLFFWLKEKKVTAIITSEVGDIFLTRLGFEEVVADCVIELNNRLNNQISTRRLRIVKYRGSYHSTNEYPFMIDHKGITIFPIISEAPQIIVSNERISSGIKQIDEMLDGRGFYVGSSILVSGSAGTGKSSIAASFIKDVCEKKGTALYCAFEEAPNQIKRNMASIGIFLEPYEKSGNLHFYYSRPTLQTLELHFIAIKKLIKQINPSVVILDPITNLMIENINSDIRTMLTRFVDYLKMEQITVLLTATLTVSSLELIQSNEGISSMVDTCIMIQEKNIIDSRRRTLYIMKSRGICNSKKEVEFIITSEGISIAPLDMAMLIKENSSAPKNNILPETKHNGNLKKTE